MNFLVMSVLEMQRKTAEGWVSSWLSLSCIIPPPPHHLSPPHPSLSWSDSESLHVSQEINTKLEQVSLMRGLYILHIPDTRMKRLHVIETILIIQGSYTEECRAT